MARVPHVVIRPVPGPGPPVVDLPLGIPPPGMLLAAGELACPAALLRQALDGRSLARCYVRAGQAQLLCLIALDTLPQDDAPSVYLSPADRDRLCPPGTDRLELEMVSDPPVVEYLRVTVDLPGPLGDPAAAGPAPRPAAVLSAGDLSPWPPGMPVPTGRVLPAHVLGHQLGLSFDALREQGSHRPLSVGVFGPGTRLFFALPPWLRVRGTQRMALLDTPSGPLFYMAEPLRSRLYPGVLFVADTTPLQHAEHEPYFVHAGRAFVVRTVALAEPPAQRTLFAHPDDLDSLFPPSRHPQLTFMPAPRPPALRMALLRLHASSGATLRPDIEATFLQHFTGVPLSLGQAISLPGLCGEVALLQDHEGNPLPAGAFTPEDVATGRAALLLQALVPRLPAVPAAVSLIDAGALLLLARVVISDRPRRGEALLSPGAMGLLRRKLAPPASSRLYFSRHREFFLLNSDDQAAEHEILLHSDSAAAIRWDDGEPLLFERTTRPRTLAELTLRMLGPESLGPVDVQAALAALSDLPLMLGETYAIPGPEGASLPARVERMRWPEDAQPAPLGRVAGAPATRVALLPSHAPGPPADVPLFYLHFDEPDVPLALAVDIQPMPSGASFPARAQHQRLAGRTFVHPNTYRYIRMMAPHVTGVDIFLQVGQWFSILSPDENPRSTLAEGRVRLLDGGFPGLPSGRPWARAHIAAHAPAATTIECSIALADPQDQLLGRLNHEVIERDCFWSPHCSVLNVGQVCRRRCPSGV
ncbi:hypothetical protein H696_05057 [Fonticula alba]|uniref:Uncharacterized protein n=1 Tax=Fonticula alba TaxID=691883 RepID=A0A058Z388_FONAL|nr:hypothetical protein H696_05057 [Fonticula alba]KCV68764.1 hypothetical protein H696_05057 [Fonticula alba]|eukprot:XP_009497196.1 hypothetical protein H696_05057 [Fonticula alba]